jgi:predicted transcriptional regulator
VKEVAASIKTATEIVADICLAGREQSSGIEQIDGAGLVRAIVAQCKAGSGWVTYEIMNAAAKQFKSRCPTSSWSTAPISDAASILR